MIVELKLRDWAALETSVVDDSSDPERHLSKKCPKSSGTWGSTPCFSKTRTKIAISFGLAAAVTFGLLYLNQILRYLGAWLEAISDALKNFIRHPHAVHEYQILYERNADSKVVKSSSYLRPVLILRDPDLIKSVIAKDFEYFTDRPSKGNSSELFDLNGEIWRNAKRALSPFFSPEPLRGLFEYFTSNLGTLITRVSQKASPVDVSGPVEICVSDIVSLAIFGLKITIGHKKDEFTRHALSVIAGGPLRRIRSFLFGEKRMPSEAEKYFKGFLTKKFQSSLQASPDFDFVKLLSLTKGKGITEIGHSTESPKNENSNPYQSSEEDVAVSEDVLQDAVLQFLTSGFEPIVAAVTFVLYDLSREPNDIQTKIRNEVVSCMTKNSGYNYDAIREMRFLDGCVSESLRLHPPVHTISRVCVKDYASPDGISFDRGDSIAISILGVHMDKQHFPEPEKFMPQRFENEETRNTFFYMPFGCGPRKCVGDHYARLVIKAIAAKLIYQFNFSLSQECRNKLPHVLKGPYIVPNQIKFNVKLAQTTSILK